MNRSTVTIKLALFVAGIVLLFAGRAMSMPTGGFVELGGAVSFFASAFWGDSDPPARGE
jgi:membrane-bound ClpP family serine protease